jgi:serine/threonine protein kinase
VGTQGYMPIEQARGKPRSSSDIYALGMLGIQALTGVKPLDLEEDEQGEIMWSHLIDTQTELIEILTKMTRYNHMDRYPSAQSVLDALNSCFPPAVKLPVSTMKQAILKSLPAKNQQQVELNTDKDPNALPGIRSFAVVANRSPKVQPKLAKQKLGKIALMVIIISGGIYLSLHELFIQPALDVSHPEATPDNNFKNN